jgi:DNA-binding SARP family transcriptional activator
VLRCLGGFSLTIDGTFVDDSTAKPMERSLLHLLCMRSGEAVHREQLVESLWPEADPEAGRHRLQVAISALRRLLGNAAGPDAQLLARSGDTYRLDLPERSYVDLIAFDRAGRDANSARSRGDQPAEEQALAEALAVYRGPLLPGDGPAEWVVTRRDQLQSEAAEVAARLAALRLDNGNLPGALEAARAGVGVDRYRDDIWKLLIDAAERAGNVAEAGQARRAYDAVLDELD